MHFFNFAGLANCDFSPVQVVETLSTNELKTVSNAFVRNIHRLAAGIDINTGLVGMTRLWEQCHEKARKEMAANESSAIKLVNDQLTLDDRATLLFFDAAREQSSRGDDERKSEFVSLLKLVDRFAKYMGDKGFVSLEAILFSSVIHSYLTFEVLAGDLLIKALDLRPKWAARVVGKRGGPKDAEKTVRVAMLEKYQFDLRSVMGQLLKREGKVKFDSFPEIERSYERVFGHAVLKVFSGQDGEEVKWLEAVRNVIAHTGGVVDEKFVKRVEKHIIFKNYKLGEVIHIDGDIVSNMVNASVRISSELLKYVDGELRSNAS